MLIIILSVILALSLLANIWQRYDIRRTRAIIREEIAELRESLTAPDELVQENHRLAARCHEIEEQNNALIAHNVTITRDLAKR